jgi:predicted translin family RNA/ssDNA-binding protein
MLDKNFINKLFKKYSDYYKKRYEIIKISNDILRNSKQAIFALQRNDYKQADKLLKTSKEKVMLILKGIDKNKYSYEGAFGAALEEYIEAQLFNSYIQGKKLAAISHIDIKYFDAYISGLCDFTGELVRRSVLKGAQRDVNTVVNIQNLVENIYQQLSKFSLTGKLRSKYDELKRNLYRIEEILYDLKIRED